MTNRSKLSKARAYRTFLSAEAMDRTQPEANFRAPVNSGGLADVSQGFSAAGQAQQAVQGSGVQNVFLTRSDADVEPLVSIMPPFGRRSEKLPLRGRDELLSMLAAGEHDARVWVIHGLGGSGKTSLALEVAFQAQKSAPMCGE